MNKKFKKLFWTMCLAALVILCQAPQAMAAGEVTTVSTFSGLYSAIIQANDGDVIGITGLIDQNAIQNIGYADKHITIKRMDSSAILRIQSEAIYQNITFDGGGIDSTAAFVITNGNITFQDCVFQNSLTSTANGGAVYVLNKTTSFKNCTFNNNTAVQGGHIYVANPANVTIENCTFENGHALSDGGAIKNTTQPPASCNITSSIITNNSADKYGGGISNTGNIVISGTKIFNNTASGGGADIARFSYFFSMYDSIETEGLLELFKDDEIVPKGWVNDYNAESGIEIPAGFDLLSPNVLMKLDYEIPPTEVILNSSSLGIAGNGKIIGLESGKQYKVTVDDVISYSKFDGTLTPNESEIEALLGTEIIGLTNGLTYKVEEYIPAPVEEEPEEPGTVILDSSSLGTAGDGKISELTPGKTYKVIIIAYVKADGTLTSIESEAEPLNGTDILGLTNGKLYKVEEYPSVEPEPQPEEEPGQDNQQPDPEEEPVDQEEEPTPTPEPQPQPDPTPVPVTPSTPSESNHRSSSSHSNHSVVVEPVVEQKAAVVLSYGKAVLDTTKTEYLLGYTDGLMGNKDIVTRAQLAQIVYRLLTTESKAAVYSEKNNFKDVASNAWYNEAVSSIANAGLISVGADGKFNPDKNVTWGEMVTILAKFAEPNFEWKIITRHWARDAINTAISYRWFEYNDQFNPDGEVTRVEMLTFIYAIFDWTTE